MLIKGCAIPQEPSRHGTPKAVLLSSGILPGVTQVAVATLEAASEVEMHVHPTMYEIYYFLEGKAKYWVGNNQWNVEAGDLLVVPPNTPHRQEVTEAPHRAFYWGIATEGEV